MSQIRAIRCPEIQRKGRPSLSPHHAEVARKEAEKLHHTLTEKSLGKKHKNSSFLSVRCRHIGQWQEASKERLIYLLAGFGWRCVYNPVGECIIAVRDGE
ncbi:MAG: hypothetical protein ACOH5I_21990 [Oligoflexus sp.]